MKTFASIIIASALATSAFAGSPVSYGKNPMGPAPEPACFGAGFDIGIFGGALLPRHKTNGFDNSLGGGVLAEYFFNAMIGIQGSYGVYATSSETHLFNGDIILRAPIQSACIAPYLMVGGGYEVDGTSHGQYHAGVGIEARLHSFNKMGIFADGAYYWHGSGFRDLDGTVVRLGVKFEL